MKKPSKEEQYKQLLEQLFDLSWETTIEDGRWTNVSYEEIQRLYKKYTSIKA